MSNYAEHDLIEIEDDWINFLHSSPVTTIGALMKIPAWDESLHPRAPAGTSEGGQFVSSLSSITPVIDELRSNKEIEICVVTDANGNELTRSVGDPESVSGNLPSGHSGMIVIHNHIDDTSLSYKDVILGNKWARDGRVKSMVVVGPSNIYSLSINSPWTQLEWNKTILPKLEKEERKISRKIQMEEDSSFISGGPSLHRLWSWAVTSGPLKGRAEYSRTRLGKK